MRKAIEVIVNAEDKALMEKLVGAKQLKHKYAVRLQAVLNRINGKGPKETAEFLGIHINSVTQFVKRYNKEGINALIQEKTRNPGRSPLTVEKKKEICDAACHQKPENATQWSTRLLAKKVGVSHNAVSKVLRENGIKPHIQSYYSTSNDPEFEDKLTDVVGLYLNPPDNAIVFCVDEKTSIQALERTQFSLFPQHKLPPHQSNDYIRHGTTTLFAALDVVSGNVIGDCKDTHKTEDYLDFIKELDRKSEKGKVLHIIADNYKTHKTALLQEYLKEHPGRFVLHFVPTHSSWLNMVERFFREITCQRIRRESWHSVKELIDAIRAYIVGWNKSGRKFTWTKTSDDIMRKINKRKERNSYV